MIIMAMASASPGDQYTYNLLSPLQLRKSCLIVDLLFLAVPACASRLLISWRERPEGCWMR